MSERLEITKTYKLFIGGTLPRSESGRSIPVHKHGGGVLAHVCRASRKDFRSAVEAARKAQPGWKAATPYLRGQILYRMAEMMEGKHAEFVQALRDVDGRDQVSAHGEVDAAIDRLVSFAGWADKFAQVLGCANPVAGPYHNFTVPEPVGVVAIMVSSERPLLGLISTIAPAMATGNAVIAISDEANPLPACILAEVAATSDVPAGVLNILTGVHDELIPHITGHAGVDTIVSSGLSTEARGRLLEGSALDLKRVHSIDAPMGFVDERRFESPSALEPYLEFKTMWHPSAT